MLHKRKKDNALQHLDEQVKEIINSINQANTDNEVDNAKTSGLNNITEYRPEYNKKKNAILKLYDVSDTQEAIINGYPDATEDELQEANSKLNKILLDAKNKLVLRTQIMKLMIFIMRFPKNENYFTTCRYKSGSTFCT